MVINLTENVTLFQELLKTHNACHVNPALAVAIYIYIKKKKISTLIYLRYFPGRQNYCQSQWYKIYYTIYSVL